MDEQNLPSQLPQQTIIVNQQPATNTIGIVGFIISFLAFFLGWIPFLGWLIWILGAVFSFVGIFKAPRGFAIAGLIISFIGILFLLFFFGFILTAASLNSVQ